jgi:hypothetical protein
MTLGGGTISGPQYAPNVVASESSGRKCVRLDVTGQYVEFTAQAAANALVVRSAAADEKTSRGEEPV